MRETKTHIYFWGSELSNFWDAPFQMDGLKFATSEQAFMYLKAKQFNDDEIALKILKAPTPLHAKKLGRAVRGYDDDIWSSVRYEAMVTALEHKFARPDMKRFLLSTTNKTLVEASPYDVIWGVGLSEDDNRILHERNWKGQNLLGIALMEVRRRLIQECE